MLLCETYVGEDGPFRMDIRRMELINSSNELEMDLSEYEGALEGYGKERLLTHKLVRPDGSLSDTIASRGLLSKGQNFKNLRRCTSARRV